MDYNDNREAEPGKGAICMRLFIAIPLNAVMRQTVADVQDAFRRLGVRGNFTPRDNLHITLAFIGDHNDPGEVMEALEKVSFAPFTVTMEGVGCFQGLWWTGLSDTPELDDLARKVRRALSEKGIPYDKKKFRAHVTCLRRPEYSGDESIPQVSVNPADLCVDHISLFRSTRGKKGMIYTELGTVSALQ